MRGSWSCGRNAPGPQESHDFPEEVFVTASGWFMTRRGKNCQSMSHWSREKVGEIARKEIFVFCKIRRKVV